MLYDVRSKRDRAPSELHVSLVSGATYHHHSRACTASHMMILGLGSSESGTVFEYGLEDGISVLNNGDSCGVLTDRGQALSMPQVVTMADKRPSHLDSCRIATAM